MCGYLDVPGVEWADDVDLAVPALVLLVHNVDDVVRVVDPETEHGIKARAGNEPSRIFVVSQCTITETAGKLVSQPTKTNKGSFPALIKEALVKL